MNIKSLILFIAIAILSLFASLQCRGQNRFKDNNVDSAAVQKRVNREFFLRDSMVTANKLKKKNDSIARVLEKIKIQQYRDSLVQARIAKRIKDSTDRELAKQKLLTEKRKKDSLELVRKNQLSDSLKLVAAKADSIRKRENDIRDSINIARLKVQDSIAKVRQKQADSMKAVRLAQQKEKELRDQYINSKPYKDSVIARRKQIQDSTNAARFAILEKQKQIREQYNDSVNKARKMANDIIIAQRDRISDSTKSALQKQNEILKNERLRVKDSMLAARQRRVDSLEVLKKEKEKKEGTAKKLSDEKKKLALAIKIHDSKQKEWSNDKLLKRKWNLPRKIYQNTVTRYNYHYHAKRKYNDAIQRITKSNKEDFTKQISLLPYNAEKDGASISSDMDTVIKKASFSTQIHDPRSKWFDDLYFLMGKASFAKNDFEGAITTFQFIANEYKTTQKGQAIANKKGETLSIANIEKRKGLRKLSHHPIRNDALLWLAKSYMMAEQYGNAQSLLTTLQKDPHYPARNKAALFLTKASLDIKQGETKAAIESLELALTQKIANQQRVRAEFLLGQLYAEKGDFAKSSEHYKKSIDGKNNPEMDFYTKLNIAVNASKGGGNKDYAKQELQKIIGDQKYVKYKSEALNTLAAIEAEDNIAVAADLLKKSIKNTENKDVKQKAIAFAGLGAIYYKLSEYELAKKSYDSASIYGSNPPIDNIDEVNVRKVVLGEIVGYIKTIKGQDSMIRLAQMSDKEQKAAAKRELDKLRKLKEEKAAAPNELQVVALQPSGPVKSNWYFYNNGLLQKGSTEFKQKWGNRKLEDNWRRSAATNNFNLASGEGEGDGDAESEKDGTDGVTIKSLLALLPKTPAQLDAAHVKIQDAYYNLGLTYYSQLADYMNAVKTFDSLLHKYPNTTYKEQTYYALYLNFDKLNQKASAQKYKNLLVEEFGQSEFAMLANNPNYKEQSKNKSKSIFEHYDNTYQMYKQGKYREALDRVVYAKVAYKENPIQAKYALVEAISEAGLNDLPKCKIILQDIISKYPNSDEQIRAQEILNQLSLQNGKDSGQVQDIIIPNFNKYDDSLEASNAFKELRAFDGKGIFSLAPNEEHFVLIFMKNVDGRTMALKAAMSDYNLLKNNMQEYTTALNLLTAQQGIITIQKFSNSIFAKKYLNELANEKLIFTQLKKNEYDLAIISTSNYSELLRSRDILGYLKFYKKNYK